MRRHGILRTCDEHIDDVLLHAYKHTHIHRYMYNEFAILCFSCIWGLLRLAPNKTLIWVHEMHGRMHPH